jgi:Threonine aldolase
MEQFKEKLHFASDYMEGAHPKVLDALVRTNALSTPGYGGDAFCRSAERLILDECGCPDGEVHFLVGGTQTNAVVIDALLQSYQGVLAAETGHVFVHEAGAIELGGHKVLTVPQNAGKLSAESIRQAVRAYREDANREHMVMPGMVYLSQPTEYGTLYSRAELAEISRVCHEAGVYLYADGARLAYALAAPENDVTLRDLAALTDVFYIGGTKCGALFGEAVVFPKKGLIPHFFSIVKQHGALLAKGRLLGVQFGALFEDGLYGRIGAPAIRSARRIREKLAERGYEMPIQSPTNQIFAVLEDSALERLGENVEYGFMEKADETHTMIRFAAAWSTTDAQTQALLRLLDK